MKIGLVGLPKSGKTTLFNLLTGASVATSRYDAGRSEMHTGVARVPDPRVDRLSELFKPKKTTYATFEVVDLAGIEKGERTALDAKEFRNADALLHVVRAFGDEARGAPDPRRDVLDLELELIFADLEVVDRRVERLEASIKKQRKDAEVQEHAVLTRLKTSLEAETPLRAVTMTPDEVRLIRGFTFLSQKPILHLVNVEEAGIAQADKIADQYQLTDVAARPLTRVGWVSAVIEAEIAQLAGDEQQVFLA
ncbi:MAG TPA: GTPase, partial [Candidatus Limnocylindria bacterium]